MVFGKAWTEIANNALVRIGRKKVQTIEDTDQDFDTSLIRDQLKYAVAEVLAVRSWRCMTTQVKLEKLIYTPADYAYRYAVPQDTVRIVKVITAKEGQGYATGSAYIDTDSDTCFINCIRIPDNTSTVPVWMADLFSLNLAAKIALPLSADKSILQLVQQEYAAALTNAMHTDEADMQDTLQDAASLLSGLNRATFARGMEA
jgi:hypothetical protein